MKRREFMSSLAGVAAATMGAQARAGLDPFAGDGPLKIGQSAVFTGPSAALGLEMKDGMEACLAAVNRAGGVHGREVRLISLDDGYEPDRAAANVQRLIAEGVFGFCGFVGTPTSLKVLPEITAQHIPFIGAFTGAQGLRSPFNRYVFNVRAGYDLEAKKLVRQLAVVTGARIGLFVQDDGYGTAVSNAVAAAIDELGLPAAVAVAKVPRNASGDVLNAAIAKAASTFKTAGVTGVAMGSVYGACVKLSEALAAAHFYPMLASVSFVGTTNLLKAGTCARGIAVAQVMPSPTAPTRKVTQAYNKAMQECGKKELTYGSIEGYVGCRAFIAGLQRCGPNPTRERFVSALESPARPGRPRARLLADESQRLQVR